MTEDQITPEELVEMDALEGEASPGPWATYTHKHELHIRSTEPGEDGPRICTMDGLDEEWEANDAAFIAKARTFVPKALAALRSLQVGGPQVVRPFADLVKPLADGSVPAEVIAGLAVPGIEIGSCRNEAEDCGYVLVRGMKDHLPLRVFITTAFDVYILGTATYEPHVRNQAKIFDYLRSTGFLPSGTVGAAPDLPAYVAAYKPIAGGRADQALQALRQRVSPDRMLFIKKLDDRTGGVLAHLTPDADYREAFSDSQQLNDYLQAENFELRQRLAAAGPASTVGGAAEARPKCQDCRDSGGVEVGKPASEFYLKDEGAWYVACANEAERDELIAYAHAVAEFKEPLCGYGPADLLLECWENKMWADDFKRDKGQQITADEFRAMCDRYATQQEGRKEEGHA